ncbi:hypothetical protein F5X97DRAFT_317967 [Nemania serpens]|nr:hypothetical protein F5X97DRAFT_317967 [Nemania serpens]
MKFLAIAALAATALAASTPLDTRKAQCTPPSYVCKADKSGWLVCNVDGTFLDGGVCPKGTKCAPINNLPYCI